MGEVAPEPNTEMPERIDRYELLRKLATGGMAELFLAKQGGLEGFEKVVVLKRILSNLAADDDFVSMFLDEARIAAKLSHPNIVQIYDLGKSDDSYYIAMEYVSGRNVQHLIEKEDAAGKKIPVEHVCRIAAGVCDGLYYAHTRKDYDGTALNIVHRDVSPQNILVSFAGGVKLVDFGIAKASTQLAQTRAGVLKGKYAYMSPEQVRGVKIDHRADIFAVGLVMYEMLTGTRAFERESSLKTLKAIVQDKPLNPRELNPDVPMEVVKLLSRALEKNPDRRYKNAQEMQLALEDYLERSPKKSNNIRLSRYLYDLFDDELNSDTGTLIVKGIGEVIIPTGQGPSTRKPRVEEEVDAKTLSAALMPDAPQPPAPTLSSLEESADRWKGAPTTRHPIATSENSGTLPGASLADMPVGSESSEEEDKTIPAFSMEDYERELTARAAASEARSATLTGTSDGDGFSDDAKTVAGLGSFDPSAQPPVSQPSDPHLEPSLPEEDAEATVAVVGDGHPEDLVARLRESEDQAALTEEIEPDKLLNLPSSPSSVQPDQWDEATASAPGMPSLDHSAAGATPVPSQQSLAPQPPMAASPSLDQEIVPGLTGPPPVEDSASPQPAPSSPPTPSSPAAGPDVLPPLAPASTAGAPSLHPAQQPTADTAALPAAPQRSAGIPLLYIAAGLGTFALLFGALALVAVWFIFLREPSAPPPAAQIAVQVMANCDCQLTVDGNRNEAINSVVYLPPGNHEFVLLKDGKTKARRKILLEKSKNFYLIQFD